MDSSDSTVVVTRYMRNVENGHIVGAISGVFKEGKVGVGVSICNPKDRFVKSEGRRLAESRAMENLKKMSNIGEIYYSVISELSEAVPSFSRHAVKHMENDFKDSFSILGELWTWRGCFVLQDITNFKNDFLYRIAVHYMKSFT